MKQPGSLLALTGYVASERIEAVILSLSAIWQHSMGRHVGDLEADLAQCRRWFDPVAQGQRLRRDLSAIPPIDADTEDPGPPLTFRLGEGRSLVTPEGRCVLDLFMHLAKDRKGHVISDTHLTPYDRLLGHLYKDWSRHRLESVVGLLAGGEKPLQIAAAGVVIALLVNRSTSPRRALKRFPAGAARDVIDEAFFEAVRVFARTLSPKQRPTRDPRLISGWMLYEARRRLGDDVLVVENARPDTEGRLWIAESKQDQIIDVVARDLGRGHRARLTPDDLSKALDGLVAAFRSQTPRLAGFGLAHERPTNTRKICDAIIKRFRQYAEAS